MTLDDRLKDNIGGDYGGIDLVEDDYTVLRLAILSDLLEIIDSCFENNDGFIDEKLRERVKKYCD